MRAFIAIELPKNLKDYLSHVQNQLRNSAADVKWVEPNNIHLTLKFLGEIDDKRLNKIIQVMEEITTQKAPFQVRLSGIGAFPKMDYPRVIWIGVDKGESETKEMVRELEQKIAKIGIPKENRQFSSHITIGRVRSNLNREKLALAMKNISHNQEQEKLEFLVTKITLFKSTLTPKGPIYEVIKEANLKTS